MYTQSVKGPRWFLPERFKGLVFNFYKTKNEVLFMKPDAEFVIKNNFYFNLLFF